MTRLAPALLLFLCVEAFAEAQVAPFRGRVIKVADGDSMVVRAANGRSVKVRISAIDAPEQGQSYADRSRQSLRALTSGVEVEVLPRDVDPYGRVVGRVLARGSDVGLEQIRRGFAWHYVQFASQQGTEERVAFSAAERRARAAACGLWTQPSPVAPWKWRRQGPRRR